MECKYCNCVKFILVRSLQNDIVNIPFKFSRFAVAIVLSEELNSTFPAKYPSHETNLLFENIH